METVQKILKLNGLLELVEVHPQGTRFTVYPKAQSFVANLNVASRVTNALERAGYKPVVSGSATATAWKL